MRYQGLGNERLVYEDGKIVAVGKLYGESDQELDASTRNLSQADLQRRMIKQIVSHMDTANEKLSAGSH